MITEDELSQLRSGGATDDDILAKYRQFAPSESDDIGKLLEDKQPASKILDKLAQYHTPSMASRVGSAVSEGASELGRAFRYGVASDVNAFSRGAKHLGMDTASDVLKAGGDLIGPDGYEPVSLGTTYSTKDGYGQAIMKSLGGTGKYLAQLGGQLVGPLIAAGAAPETAAGGLLAAGGYGALRAFGPSVDERAANNGHAEATLGDKLGALPGSLAEGAVNAVGLKAGKIIGPAGTGKVADQLVEAGLGNATGSAAGTLAHQVGTSLGTDKGLTIDPKQIAESAIDGIAGGSLAKGAHILHKGASDRVNDWRDSDTNREFVPGLRDRILSADGDTVNDKLTTTIDALKNNVRTASKQHSGNEAVAEATDALKSGVVLAPERLEAIRSRLEANDGHELFQSLGQWNEANRLASKQGEGVAGWLSKHTGLMEKASAGNVIGSAAKYAGKYALTGYLIGGGKLSVPHVAALLALPGLVKGGARAIDSVTGRGDPVGRFLTRYKALEALPKPQVPMSPLGSPGAGAAPEAFRPPSVADGENVRSPQFQQQPVPAPNRVGLPEAPQVPIADADAPSAWGPRPQEAPRGPNVFPGDSVPAPKVERPIPPVDFEKAKAMLAMVAARNAATQAPQSPIRNAPVMQDIAADPHAPPKDRAQLAAWLARQKIAARGSENAPTPFGDPEVIPSAGKMAPEREIPAADPEGLARARADMETYQAQQTAHARDLANIIKVTTNAKGKKTVKTEAPKAEVPPAIETPAPKAEDANPFPQPDLTLELENHSQDMTGKAIKRDVGVYKRGALDREAFKETVYEKPVKGLDAEDLAKWKEDLKRNKSATEMDGGELRSMANKWSRDLATPAKEALLVKHLEKRKYSAKSIKAITEHFNEHHYWRAWREPRTNKKT